MRGGKARRALCRHLPIVWIGRLPPLGALVKPCATHRHTVPLGALAGYHAVNATKVQSTRAWATTPPPPRACSAPSIVGNSEKSELGIVVHIKRRLLSTKVPLKLVRHARVGDNQTCATDQWEHGGAIPMPHFSYEHSPRLTPSTNRGQR